MAKTAPVQSRRDVMPTAVPEAGPKKSRVSRGFDLYRSAVGKKYVMAVTGIFLMAYVFVHMLGNLKLYLGAAELNEYGEWLRELLVPFFPRTVTLWILRIGLFGAFVLHIHASYALTRMNMRSRPVKYQSKRDYVAANFAARTMRYSGMIVLLFLLYHLADLTWGFANPDFVRGDVFHNVIASFSFWPAALFYILANLALGVHLYHGSWSLFQSLGINNPRFNHWRRYFAVAFALVVTLGNLSFPMAVLLGYGR
jgi:succinate dehydrogenase / fumarate reductase cytochrome b subunit